jgi:hypothetical protein
MLAGCGTFTPEIEEFWGSPADASVKVNKISGQVVCELRRAVQQVFADYQNGYLELRSSPGHPAPKVRDLAWFEKWGAQVTLNLNIIENTSISPGVTLNKVLPNAVTPFPVGGNVTTGQSVSTALGGTFTTTATRTDKIGIFYTVKELRYGTPSIDKTCFVGSANADLFLQSDLKLRDWLRAALLPSGANIVDFANNSKNTISHEVKFEIVTSGSVTPSWKLVRVSANSAGTFFGAGRTRSQDLTITVGPIDSGGGGGGGGAAGARAKGRPPQLATAAQNADLAQQIGAAVAQALRTP